MSHCGYPGHAMKLECEPDRIRVRMPSGRVYSCCPLAASLATRPGRGGKVIARLRN